MVAHDAWLVALSLVVAIQGAYVGLSLTDQIGGTTGFRRRLLLAAAAISFAVTIWSMHFVGMLAARLPFPVDYLVFPTLLSFLVCVMVVGAAVFAVSAGQLTRVRLAASAGFMGAGIASMHYIGMTALHSSAHMEHAPLVVVASVAVGIAASGLGLWLAGGQHRRPPLLLSATALGMAIAGMHYTAMGGVTLIPFDIRSAGAPALSPDLLAIVVAIVAFILSAIFLLTLVPDRSDWLAPPVPDGDLHDPASAPGPGLAPATGAARRLAEQLPVERDGATHYVAVADIVAVHANAHYSYVFDGKSKFFCPLAIGDVASRLDGRRFLRVHRSHIVNVDRIIGLKRVGDTGIIELEALDRYTVPVSRSGLAPLRARLDLKTGQVLHQAVP